MDARLQITDSGGRRVIPVDKPIFLIGRRTAADLQLVNADVSREHAEIAHDGLTLPAARSRLALRHVRQRRADHRAAAGARRPHPSRPHRRRRAGVHVRRQFEHQRRPGSARSAPTQRSPADGGDPQRPARARLGSRARRGADAGARLGARRRPRPSAASSCWRGRDGELEFKTARGRGRITLPGTSFTTSAKIPREVFQTGESRIVGDLMDGNLAGMHDGTIAIGIRHVLCVPLQRQSDGRVGRSGHHGAGHWRALSRWPRAQHDAVAADPVVARSVRDAGRAGDRKRPALRRVRGEGAHRARPARRRRDPAGAAARRDRSRTSFVDLAASSVPCRTVGGDFFDYVDLGESRLRLRAWRRGGQGAAGGAARRRRAEQLRRAGAGERRPRGHADAGQQRAAAPRHRSALRDDVPRRRAIRMAV